YDVTGQASVHGRTTGDQPMPRWYPYTAAAMKIQLLAEKVQFYVSTDGKQWELDHEIERGPQLQQGPQWAILGNIGLPGEAPLFKNTTAEHFNPEHGGRVTFYSDFVV